MDSYSSGNNNVDSVDQLRSNPDEVGKGRDYRVFVLLATDPPAIEPGLPPVSNNAPPVQLIDHHNAGLAPRSARHISGPVMPAKKSSPAGHHPWSCLCSGHMAGYSTHIGTAERYGTAKEAGEDMKQRDKCSEVLWPVGKTQAGHTVRNV